MKYHASACAALCLFAAAATASPQVEVVSADRDAIVRSVRVTVSGAPRAVEARLRWAARQVCRVLDDDRLSRDSVHCYYAALADARAQLVTQTRLAGGDAPQQRQALR